MNEKKKGFNLFPEYVWMIFVGMLLAILILTYVIPGHAGEITPVAGTNSIGFSYESPDYPEFVYTSPFRTGVILDSQGYYNWTDPPQKVFASNDYGVNYYSVINSTRFSNDVNLIKGSVGFDFAGTSLLHVSKANFTGYLPGSVQESWYEDFQESGYTYFGCDLWAFFADDISYTPECIGYIIIKFSDNEIPVVSKVNRVFNTELFQVDFDESKVVETLTFFNDRAWIVWGFDFPSDADFWALGSQVIYDGLYDHSVDNHRIYVKTVNRGDFYFDHVSYNEQYTSNYKYRANINCLDLHRVPDPEEPTPTTAPGTGDQLSLDVLEAAEAFYDLYPDYQIIDYYGLGSGTPFGFFHIVPLSSFDSSIVPICDEYTANSRYYIRIQYFYESFYSIAIYFSNGVYNFSGLESVSNVLESNGPFNSPFFNNYYKIAFVPSWYQQGYYYPGLRSKFYPLWTDSEPELEPTPSPSPTPSPTISPSPTTEPLPTSGESVHVILPTGTPSPTPPFSVSGGSDGGIGSGSGSGTPGSIGSGLSSGQTSGVLQAWQLYVSDNPAMLFLTSTFQSLPQELLYPLYILLFILLLLAVIRLFVHFSGG